MIETVRLALGRPARRSRHYECRDCGTALRAKQSECPSCESADIAVYEL